MFKGLSQLGDMAGMMKQAQEMQKQMKTAQDEIDEMISEGEAGGGLVRVTAKGKGTITSVSVDPTILREDSKEIVEDLLLTAVNDAQSKAADRAQKRLAEITGDLQIPDQLKNMF